MKKKPKYLQPTIGGGVRLDTGRDLSNEAYPVFFVLRIPGIQPLTTYWSPDDAEGIAMAILKQVELARRYFATPRLARTLPTPVLPAPIPAHTVRMDEAATKPE